MKREIIAKHFGESWVDFMVPFMQSAEATSLFAFLKKEKEEGKKIIPASDMIFRCFRETPLDTLRIVIVGQDPYPKEKDASGLAFSVDRDADYPASLSKIFTAIEKDCYDGMALNKAEWSGNLTRWTKQGILLFNSALTVVESSPGSHKDAWKPFSKFVMNQLNDIMKDIVFIAWGKDAQETVRDVNPLFHFILTAEHPSFAAREKREWDFRNCFSKANAIITSHRMGDKINW